IGDWSVTGVQTCALPISYSDRLNHAVSPGLGADPGQLLGLKGAPSGAFPQFTVAGMSSLGSGTHERVQFPIRQQQYINSWTWVRSEERRVGKECRTRWLR